MAYPGVVSQTVRPNRLTADKGKKYHRQYGRWVLGSINSSYHQYFVTKSSINWAFYKGNQWIFTEDLQAFLMDESGDERNRIKFVENLIRPMVEQYVGNAIRLNLHMQAVGISDFAVNRREIELGRLKTLAGYAKAAEDFEFGQMMKDKLPIGDTDEETEEIFENVYTDEFEQSINYLIEYIMDYNDFEDKKVVLSKHLALDGVAIMFGTEYNGEYLWEVQDPRYFIFDRSAQRPDLKDAEYMGRYHHMLPTNIYEKYQTLTLQEKKDIEAYTQDAGSNSRTVWRYGMYIPTGGRVPVYELYWRDIQTADYGYVLDDYGYEFFTEINTPISPYTDKDLIWPKEKGHQDILKGKKKKKVYTDILRFCVFIPTEIVSTKDSEDIVLDYGIMPYQETSLSNPSNVDFPFKCYCWAYNNGDILSPIDDAISPQRYLNRIQSVSEAAVNNSRMSGTILDKDMIDPQGGEDEVQRNINLGKPVFVQAKGNLNNSVGSYDFTAGAGVMNLYNITQQVRQTIQNITGVNEAMQGTAGGSKRLVGVTEIDIQRGTLLQEPFYYALANVVLQCAQAIANVGKKIYANNNRKLSIMVGDKGAQTIRVTDEMAIEDFRVFIKRTTGDEEQKQAGNSLLFTLVGAGLIDGKRFANLFNRSNIDNIAKGMREYQQDQIEAAKRQQEAQQGQAAQQADEIQGAVEMDQSVKDLDSARENEMKNADLEREMAKIRERELSKGLRL